MIAIAVDDEQFSLESLRKAVESSPDITEVYPFSNCSDTLVWAEEHEYDMAFLDINMRGIGGLALAKKLKELRPNCYIVFTTAFEEYALDAFRLHANGYLMKPILADRIQEEVNSCLQRQKKKKLLSIQCFGGFEVRCDGMPLHFKRTRSKELLALLVDRNGISLTARQLCAILWQDNGGADRKNMQYLWQLLADLKNTLQENGVENVLMKSGTGYLIDPNTLDCDYYRHLEDPKTFPVTGEYMAQYSWAEETRRRLLKKKR